MAKGRGRSHIRVIGNHYGIQQLGVRSTPFARNTITVTTSIVHDGNGNIVSMNRSVVRTNHKTGEITPLQ